MSYQIYTDPHFPAEKTLSGLRGSSFIETGYVYAPYVPLQTTPLFPESPVYKRIRKAGLKRAPVVNLTPEDFKPRAGILTRYGSKVVTKEDYYGHITILG